MIQLILNNKGSIVNTNYDHFRNYDTIFDLGFNTNSLNITVNTYETLLINTLEKNYIVKNLKMNFNDMGLIYLIFEEYKNVHLNLEIKNVNEELYYIDNYDSVEQAAIFAIKNGYLQDKEILFFLKDLVGFNQDLYKIQYAMKKLYTKFDVLTRSELLRKIYFYQLDNYFPREIFKPGLYNMKFKQLQLL